MPRSQNLRHLLRVLPLAQYGQITQPVDMMSFDIASANGETFAITVQFIMEVFETRATTSDLLRYWNVTRQVLQHAVRSLDPHRYGIEVTVVRCMQPGRDGKIRSLRESIGLGSPPWSGDLEEKALLLGAESLSGYVTVAGHLEQIGDLRSNATFLPAYPGEHEVSAVACPLMYSGRVAGCLLAVSTQPDYFATEARIMLMKGYAHLLSLAFEPEEFYASDLLELAIMPPIPAQRVHFSTFRQRVLSLMRESSYTGSYLASTEAEKMVWGEMEAAMLKGQAP